MEIKPIAKEIYETLKQAGLTEEGACAVIANLHHESGLIPNNLENSYSEKFGVTDEEYTEEVDKGYRDKNSFSNDSAGYGLAQWTYFSRKAGLYDLAKSKGKSIGDKDIQVEYLLKELKEYSGVWHIITTSKNLKECSDTVLTEFERPYDQSEAALSRRYTTAVNYYNALNGKEESGRKKIVELCRESLGAVMGDAEHKRIIDIYNSHKPLARGYAMKYSDDWCAAFASEKYIEAGMADLFPLEVGCGKMIDKAINMGIWVESDAYTPSPADGIIYYWDDNGNGELTYGADHVGIVEEVYDNGTFCVIEGNMGNPRHVGRRTMEINGQCIRGFITPKFTDKIAPSPAPYEKDEKEPAGTYTVKAGDTLSGIAAKFGTTYHALARINGIADPNLIYVGQVLKVTETKKEEPKQEEPKEEPKQETQEVTYTVKAGDTLGAIAEKYGTTYQELARINGIENPNLIYVGQVIKIKC